MKFNLFLVACLLICHCCFVQAQPKDHKNNIILWTSGGYSSMMNDGPKTQAMGNVGMSAGFGYEMHWNHFLLQTGLEFSYYTSRMNIGDSLYVLPMIDTEGNNFKEHFTFSNTYSMQRVINTSIPILLGYKTDKGFYFLIGGKFVYNLSGNSETNTSVTSQAEYNNIIGNNNDGVISGMPNHGLDTEKRIVKNSFTLNPGFTGTIEAGLPLRKLTNLYSTKNNRSLRLALFCDYSVLSFKDNLRSDNLIVNISKTSMYLPAINGLLFYNTKSNVLNSVFVGIKLTAIFGIKKDICRCHFD